MDKAHSCSLYNTYDRLSRKPQSEDVAALTVVLCRFFRVGMCSLENVGGVGVHEISIYALAWYLYWIDRKARDY